MEGRKRAPVSAGDRLDLRTRAPPPPGQAASGLRQEEQGWETPRGLNCPAGQPTPPTWAAPPCFLGYRWPV